MPKIKEVKTLKEICLNCIVGDIKRFCMAYNSSVEPCKHFEYLQRTFSRKLLTMLIKTMALEDEYLNFLINPHLKELDLHEYNSVDMEHILDRMKIVGKTLTSINFSSWNMSEETLKEMTHSLPNIETMNISDTECTDEVLKCIACNCPLLETLDVTGCSKITDKGLINLCMTDDTGEVVKNFKLVNLSVEHTKVTDKGILFVLKNIPSLATLKYDNVPEVIYEAHENDFQNNSLEKACKYNLMSITYPLEHVYPLCDTVKVCSLLCPNITSLQVDIVICDSELLSCANFSMLREVALVCDIKNTVTFNGIAKFLELRGSELRKFDLIGGYICGRTLGKFCPKLHTLSLRDVEFQAMKDGENISASAFSYLKMFTLKDPNFDDLNTANTVNFILSSSKSMEKLHFHYAEALNDEFIDSVLKNNPLVNLTELDLSYSDINIETVERFLLGNNKLETLILEHCESMCGADYLMLKNLVTMEKLDVNIIWSDYGSDLSYSADDFDYDMYDNYDIDDYDYDFGYHDYDCDYFDAYDSDVSC